jgi:hypothetical protein
LSGSGRLGTKRRQATSSAPIHDRRKSHRNPGDDVLLRKGLIAAFALVNSSYAAQAMTKTRRLRTATGWLIGGFVALAAGGICFTLHVTVNTYERRTPHQLRRRPRSQLPLMQINRGTI